MTQLEILGLGTVLIAALIVFLRLRVTQSRRELDLKDAVRERTEELERERKRERDRGKILEMLVSSQTLGTVLDSIILLLREELPECRAAVLTRRHDGSNVAAAPGLPAPWVSALGAPHAVPFEVWKEPRCFDDPATDPAWRTFLANLDCAPPACIRSHPIGAPEMPVGALIVFEPRAGTDQGVLTSASRLAQLAIEHSRFYEDLNFQAHHDSLTGLPNRSLFEERLGRSLRESRNQNRKLAIIYVDLDHFKEINDTLSHRTGDLLLTEVADRMRRAIRPGDTVARIGGDEFNVLLSNVNSVADAEDVAGRILDCVREPFLIDGRTVNVSASLGISLFPDDGQDAEELQREADAAMYCAKNLGRNRVQCFSTRNETLDRVRMDHELRQALRNNSYEVHYQPKIAADGHFGGLEALLRLNLPAHGNIPPAVFIPIAEESGLIIALGAWVIDEVCRQIAEWSESGLGQVCVAVNVSPLQLVRSDFSRIVRDSLDKHKVAPWNLELELTESLLMRGGEESQTQMRDLREIGIRFSLDDFGTGYSSLSYLHRLPVDAIKLDRSFVQCIDTDQGALRLVQAMIGVAQGLGLSVVAEGVETEQQRSVLVAAGCPMMQGYLFAKPRPASDITEFLRRGTSDPDLLRSVPSMTCSPAEEMVEEPVAV